MSTLEIDVGDLRPRAVEFTATELVVTLVDGRKIVTASIDDSVTRPIVTRAGAAVLLPDWPAVRIRTAQVFPAVTAQAATH